MNKNYSDLNPMVRIGHVHLKVSNLEKSLKFYCDVLGFKLKQKISNQAAFIAAGDYHHHIGLNTWESQKGRNPEQGMTGLYHLAVLYPERKDLADALSRLKTHNILLEGASDHGVSEALYTRDPDNNGVELYWDRPQSVWPKDKEGNLRMYTKHLDLSSLIQELNK